ncbi:MAG: MaoC family dehydratase N-terminal domain-containing protein [Spirochaetales bacterium]|nr:MaoC family dehydratase N-terminal domain-containing protein [Spirochaetales bacterium]
MKKLNFNSIKEGDELPALTKGPITQVQLAKYAGASGDFNPIHLDNNYAKAAGLDGIIAHGMLLMGILGQMISGWAGISAVKEYSVHFKSYTRLQDRVTAKGVVEKKEENEKGKFLHCTVFVEDQNGEVKITGKVIVQCM